MSSEIAIRADGLSKCYEIYDTPRDRLKQFFLPHLRRALGLSPKQHYREFWALKDVSFEVKKGETLGIIGRNGSGKSTLLQIVCGTLSATTGSVFSHGRIAALLELGSGFNPEFTGRENIYLNGSIHGLSREEIEARYESIVHFSGLDDFIDRPIKTYSSGMAARLAFSASIHLSPDILIVDEALSVGDFQFQAKCFKKIESLKESGVSIILVSHDLSAIAQFAERVILINKGSSSLYSNPVTAINDFKKILTESTGGISTIDEPEATHLPGSRLSEFYELSRLFHRSGSREVEIIDWCIRSANKSNQVFALEFGKYYDAVVILRSYRDGVDPNISFFFTDSRGNEVAGCALNHENRSAGRLKRNDVLSVKFRFRAILRPGAYLFNLGCSETVNENLISYDRLYSMVEIIVTGNQSVIGFVHLSPEIELKLLS